MIPWERWLLLLGAINGVPEGMRSGIRYYLALDLPEFLDQEGEPNVTPAGVVRTYMYSRYENPYTIFSAVRRAEFVFPTNCFAYRLALRQLQRFYLLQLLQGGERSSGGPTIRYISTNRSNYDRWDENPQYAPAIVVSLVIIDSL